MPLLNSCLFPVAPGDEFFHDWCISHFLSHLRHSPCSPFPDITCFKNDFVQKMSCLVLGLGLGLGIKMIGSDAVVLETTIIFSVKKWRFQNRIENMLISQQLWLSFLAVCLPVHVLLFACSACCVLSKFCEI